MQPLKGFEDLLCELLFNALAVVSHSEPPVVAFVLCRDADLRFFGDAPILQAISDEVLKSQREHTAIHSDGAIMRYSAEDACAALLNSEAQVCDRLRAGQSRATGVKACGGTLRHSCITQQIINQGGKPVSTPGNLVQQLLCVSFQVRMGEASR